MKYKIILTTKMAENLRKHIHSDKSKEQMAITLCGINRIKGEIRLLGRHLVLLPSEAFSKQSSAYLEVRKEIQSHVLKLAASQGLSQIDWHSHPGDSHFISFSGIDDYHEKKLAQYLNEKISGTFYGSVVMNQNAFDARVWEADGSKIVSRSVDSIRWGDFNEEKPCSFRKGITDKTEPIDERFSRQVLAFGSAFQERLRQCRIGMIGVGGLGGVMVEMLSRLGVSDWLLVDDDVIEATNLNRLPGSTQRDVCHQTPKVNLAQRNITRANPFARVTVLPLPVSDPKVIQRLKSCDLLIVATDNHSSRLIANRLSVQYLIPLVHVGVNIDIDERKTVTDMSGEYAIPSLGKWCLQCTGIIDPQMAGWELADEELRETLHERGYIKDTPAPAVYHLNGVIASLAVSEIHNFIFPYKSLRRYLVYDELKGELLSLNVQPKDDCTVCSAEGGLLGLGDLEPLPDYENKQKVIPSSNQFEVDEAKEEVEPFLKISSENPMSAEVSHADENIRKRNHQRIRRIWQSLLRTR